jgi:hypothetical protein
VTFNGSVTFPAGTNLATGAGVCIFGPNGGTTNFGAIATGSPGVSPTITATTVQVASGTSLPSPNPAVVFTPASGSTPPNYAFTFYVNAGAAGTTGANTLISPAPSDLEGTPLAGYMIGYNSTDAKAQWQPKLVGNWYYNNSMSASASNTTAVKNMGSLTVPVLPFAWWPEVYAQANIVGAVDTRVDLIARIGTTTGTICGYGYGATGATPPPTVLFSQGLAVSSSNIIAAGAGPTTIFLNAENQTASANPWNTTSSSWFQVKACAVPS